MVFNVFMFVFPPIRPYAIKGLPRGWWIAPEAPQTPLMDRMRRPKEGGSVAVSSPKISAYGANCTGH